MKTKKLIAGLISAVTLAAVTSSVIAVAADSFKVSISSQEVAAGEKFSLTMDLSDIPSGGINGCEFGISYDSTKVTINADDVTLGKLAKDVSDVEEGLPNPLECNIEADTINIMYALGTTSSDKYISGSGTFLNISGTAKADASGKVEFKVIPVDRATTPGSSTTNSEIVFGYMSDKDETVEYTPEFVSGILTITNSDQPTTAPTDDTTPTTTSKVEGSTGVIPDGVMYGDVNTNDYVDVADIVKLNLFLLNDEANPLSDKAIANADVMRDNIINEADSSTLMNYVAMIIPYEELGKKS